MQLNIEMDKMADWGNYLIPSNRPIYLETKIALYDEKGQMVTDIKNSSMSIKMAPDYSNTYVRNTDGKGILWKASSGQR